jgi:hypothetical protein
VSEAPGPPSIFTFAHDFVGTARPAIATFLVRVMTIFDTLHQYRSE